MISLDQAEAQIAQSIEPLPPRSVAVDDSLGLTLAATVQARLTQPQWPQVAMDGYAVHLAEDANGPWQLQDSIAAAGQPTATLLPGHALRVTTGAPLPAGANTVIIQENTHTEGGQLWATQSICSGSHIRPAGEDFCHGDSLLEAGRRITPGILAALHHAGVHTVEAIPRPRMACLITGSELLRDNAPAADGKTPDTNGPYLQAWAQLRNLPCTVHHCDETPEALQALVTHHLPKVDLLVVCGGASVGPRDGSHAALQAAGGRCVFSKVAQKPGKPMALYLVDGKPVLLLPGNPAAVFCGAEWHLQHLLCRLQGLPNPPELDMAIQGPLPRVGSRTLLLRAHAAIKPDGRVHATILEGQLSHLLGNLPDCNALVRLDPGVSCPPNRTLPGTVLHGEALQPVF